MKKILCLAPLLALSGCGPLDIAAGVATVGGMATSAAAARQAPAQPLDRELLVSAEKRGRDLGNSLAMAGRRGIIAPSQDSDTAAANFCDRVNKDVAVITDPGGIASALTCRYDYQLDQAGWAFEHGDRVAYETSLGKAEAYMDQLSTILSTADQGAPQ